jgi:hypothetical protein
MNAVDQRGSLKRGRGGGGGFTMLVVWKRGGFRLGLRRSREGANLGGPN